MKIQKIINLKYADRTHDNYSVLSDSCYVTEWHKYIVFVRHKNQNLYVSQPKCWSNGTLVLVAWWGDCRFDEIYPRFV